MLEQTKISLHVSPGAKHNQLVGWKEGVLWLKIAAPPVDNKANEALIEYLSDLIDVSKSQIELVSGLGSKTKVVRVTGLKKETLMQRLQTQLF